MGIFMAAILIGLLIAIHEWGHYIVAKMSGVKVIEYAIGMGPEIFSFQWGETQYTLRALPIGGYCKLLGQEEFEEIPAEERGRSLVAKPLHIRAAVVAAGPAINLVFPIFVFLAVAALAWGEPRTAAVLGSVFGDAAIGAGLRPGDKVLAINGEPILLWDEFTPRVHGAPGQTLVLLVERDGQKQEVAVKVGEVKERDKLLRVTTHGAIGVSAYAPLAVVGVASPESAAAKAGIQTGDRIVAIDGKPIRLWNEARQALSAACGQSASVELLRPTDPLAAHRPASDSEARAWRTRAADQPPLQPFPSAEGLPPGREADERDAQALTVKLDLPAEACASPAEDVPSDASQARNALGGLWSARLFVGPVDRQTALGALIEPGDLVLKVNGKPLRDMMQLKELTLSPDNPLELAVLRQGAETMVTGRPSPIPIPAHLSGDLPPDWEIGFASITLARGVFEDSTTTEGYTLGWLLRYPFVKTWEKIAETGMILQNLFTGGVHLRQMGGIFSIFAISARAYESGITRYLEMMALISVSLGMLNLLPIPVLDGGHLTFYAIEAVSRRPIPDRVKMGFMYAGLAMLVGVMIYVLANDVRRLFWPMLFGNG